MKLIEYIMGELLFQANVKGNVHMGLEIVRAKVLNKYAWLDGKSIKDGATENYCIEFQRYVVGNRVFMKPIAVIENDLAIKRLENNHYKSSIEDTNMVGKRKFFSSLAMFILNAIFTEKYLAQWWKGVRYKIAYKAIGVYNKFTSRSNQKPRN